jgi:hypothetical protein
LAFGRGKLIGSEVTDITKKVDINRLMSLHCHMLVGAESS